MNVLFHRKSVPEHRGFFATGTPKSVLNPGRIETAALSVILQSRTKNRAEQGNRSLKLKQVRGLRWEPLLFEIKRVL